MNGPVKIQVRDRVADHLVLRQAISPPSAVAYAPEGRFERWLFQRLLRRGAIVEARPGRYFLDVAAYHRFANRWGGLAVPAGLAALVVAALLMLVLALG